jgi:hypothetical protein
MTASHPIIPMRLGEREHCPNPSCKPQNAQLSNAQAITRLQCDVRRRMAASFAS